VLAPELQSPYLALLLGLATGVSYLAHRVFVTTGSQAYQKIRFLVLAQAVSAVLRIVETKLAIGHWPVAVAGHSLLDVTIVISLVDVMRSLHKDRQLHRAWFGGLTGTAFTGTFCGLIAGTVGDPLLLNNAVSQAALVLFLAGIGWLLRGAARRSHPARIQNESVDAAAPARGASPPAGWPQPSAADDAPDRRRVAADHLSRRSWTLEKILEETLKLNSTPRLAELLDNTVRAAGEILGFHQVVLYLKSQTTDTFDVRAHVGCQADAAGGIGRVHVTQDELAELIHPRLSYANSYLSGVTHRRRHGSPAAGAKNPLAAATLAGPASAFTATEPDDVDLTLWTSETRLVVLLVTRLGEILGFLELDRPVDGLVPSLLDVRNLELLANQATVAIESAQQNARLARDNRELAQAAEKLTSLEEMKRNFVANVSHELRTPLTSISAYAELLQQDAGAMRDEVRQEFLKVISKESGRLTEIIDDILELSRMEKGRVSAEPDHIDIVEPTQQLAEIWRQRSREHSIEFDVRIDADRIALKFDPILYQQLLGHLLSNAFKFTPDHGRVRLILAERGTAVKLTVEDSGIGIPEEEMSNIFDRFYQVDGSATRAHNGQGVGLAICQDIVSRHDGRIWVENVPSGGARFTILLPRRLPVIQPVVNAQRTESDNPAQFVTRLMYWVAGSLGVQLAALLVPDRHEDALRIRAAIGIPEDLVQSARISKGVGATGSAWVSGELLHIADSASERGGAGSLDDLPYLTPSVLCAPLIAKQDTLGVLVVNHRIDGRPLDEDDARLLEALAPRVADLMQRYLAYEDHTRRFAELQRSLRATTTIGHECRENLIAVCRELCLATARRLGLPSVEIEHLALALHFYDVGLSRIPARLIHKTGPLTADERRVFEQHVPASLELLAPLELPPKARQIILHHHERYDGGGYPDGLAGESIPLGARLVSLTESFAAMLQNRSFRSAYNYDEAVTEIRRQVGTRFCPRITAEFLAEAHKRRTRIETRQHGSSDESVFVQATDRVERTPVWHESG